MKTLIETFPDGPSLTQLIELAKVEDLGGDDVTSRLLVAAEAFGTGVLRQRGAGVCCGLPIVARVCAAYDPALEVSPVDDRSMADIEGVFHESTALLRIGGPLRSLLSAERVILNFLQHLGGVATLTHRFVQAVAGTRAKIYDTRKTLPGFRLLEKYAVRAGGGFNHRMGLYDGLLVKDNHLANVPTGQISGHLASIVAQSRGESAGRLVEIEVDRLDQLAEVLKVGGVDVILLDNMDADTMRQAVTMRDAAASTTALEASGGVTMQSVRAIAETGVDRIAIGALTHSASALDIGLDMA